VKIEEYKVDLISETFKEIGKHLIFMNFGVMNFTMKNDPPFQNKTLIFECYYLMDLIE
jgi:hypothetical protein